MIDQLREIIHQHFWFNNGAVVFTWGTTVVREGMVRLVISSAFIVLCLFIAATTLWWLRRRHFGR